MIRCECNFKIFQVTEEGIKVQNLTNEENTKGLATYYCRYIKVLRNTNKNLKHVANASEENMGIKITEDKLNTLLRKNLMKEMRRYD